MKSEFIRGALQPTVRSTPSREPSQSKDKVTGTQRCSRERDGDVFPALTEAESEFINSHLADASPFWVERDGIRFLGSVPSEAPSGAEVTSGKGKASLAR